MTTLKPGRYTVTATVRNTVVVEQDEIVTELEAAGQVVEHPGSEIVDYEVGKRS